MEQARGAELRQHRRWSHLAITASALVTVVSGTLLCVPARDTRLIALAALLCSLLALAAAWRTDLAARNLEARLVSEASRRMGIAGRLVHELQTPLLELRLAAEHLESSAGSHAARLGFGIPSIVARIVALIEIFKQLVDPRSQDGAIVNLNKVCESVVHAWKAMSSQEVLFLRRYSLNATVNGSEDQWLQAVLIILRNAIEAAGQSPMIELETSRRQDGDVVTVILRIVDNGPGFPVALLQQIGRDGMTTKPGADHGHGLFLAKMIVAALGGSLSVANRSDGKQGARVELSQSYAKR